MALATVRRLLAASTAFALVCGGSAAWAEDATPADKPAVPKPAAAAPAAAPAAKPAPAQANPTAEAKPPAVPKPAGDAPAPAKSAAALAAGDQLKTPASLEASVKVPQGVGQTDPSQLVPQLPPKPKPKKIVRAQSPSEFALPDDPAPSFQPETFFTTAKASERYAAIADAGGWPTLPANVRIGPNSSGSLVAKLRLRLGIEGDLAGNVANDGEWDGALTAAVKHYQMRVGLRQTGIASGATIKALNVPAQVRFKELASSAQRLAGVNFSFDDRYVVVNIPSTSVETVEGGRVTHRYIAIVGDPDHQSPEVQTKVQTVVLNPTWTVPSSIIKKEIIPHIRKDPGYLSRMRMRILDGSGKPIDAGKVDWNSEKAANFILRQDSGVGNSLGSIKINMPNKFAVYMHDTPGKKAFGADYRFLSHGCVRVSGVFDLGAWLLEGTSGPDGEWTAAAMKARIGKAKEDIKLAKPVPVIWVYLTGFATTDGTVHFRDDVYGIDTVGGVAELPPSQATASQ